MKANAVTQDLVVTRVFDAPVERVWQAWTQPEIVKQWWGPYGFSAPLAEIDFREGGVSLVCMRASPEYGGQDYYNTWTYHNIQPQAQFDFVTHFSDARGQPVAPVEQGLPADTPQGIRSRLTFRSLHENQTELTVTEYNWPVGEHMNMSRMGLEECLEKMAACLSAPPR